MRYGGKFRKKCRHNAWKDAADLLCPGGKSRGKGGLASTDRPPARNPEVDMLTLNRAVVSTDTDYGTALLDQRSGRYWTLNPTATLVLRVLVAGGDPPDAVRALLDQYDVPPATARDDVDRLVHELRAAGLLTGSVPGSPPGETRAPGTWTGPATGAEGRAGRSLRAAGRASRALARRAAARPRGRHTTRSSADRAEGGHQ
jgi:hypothetical protein